MFYENKSNTFFNQLFESEFWMSKIKYTNKFIKCEKPLRNLSECDLYYIKQKLGYRKSAIYSNQFMYCRKLYLKRTPNFN